MPISDHFIYTSAKTEKKEGYQVVARSVGVTDNLILDLEGYLYPKGLDLEKFKESRSMLLLENDKIAYSIVNNIGVGYDGRRGTLYNHTFIIDKNEFREIDYDSRVFDSYHIIDPNLRGDLDKIIVKQTSVPMKFEFVRNFDSATLPYLLRFLFLKRKLALATEISQIDLIQNLIAILPPSIRLISFSTIVNEPSKQNEYDLIRISPRNIFKLDRTWKVIEIPASKESSEVMRAGRTGIEFEYLAALILDGNQEKLVELHKTFEALPGIEAPSKIRFLAYRNLSQQSADNLKKAEYTYECAKAAQNLDHKLASEYLDKAKKYSIEAKSEELLSQIEMGELALLLEKEPISLRILEKILDRISERDPEMRHILLDKIFIKKREEFSQTGYILLKEVLSSTSRYQSDIMRLFVEQKTLHKFVLTFINENRDLPYSDWYSIWETFVHVSLSHNLNLLERLFHVFHIDLERKRELRQFRKLIYHIYSDSNFRNNASLELIVDISKAIRTNFESALDKLVAKDTSTGKLKWNSEQDFEDVKNPSFDFMLDIANCFRYVLDYRGEKLNPAVKSLIRREVAGVERVLRKLNSISYKKAAHEYSLPTWLELWMKWWGLK